MRIILIIFLGLTIVTLAIFGLRGQRSARPPIWIFPDMQDQPKYRPQMPSDFFADGRVERPQPANTVAWGRNPVRADDALALSDRQQFAMERIPLPLDRALLDRGQRLFNVYCAVCHGATGAGNGITTTPRYGMNNPPTYHQDRLRQASDGYLFQVITEGKNTMGPYGGNIHARDRWAIVAYVRALQRASNATIEDVPEPQRKELAP